MDAEDVRIRYYRWSRSDWERETSSHLAFLRAAPSALAVAAVTWLDAVGPEERLALIGAMLRRFHPEASQAEGGSPTPDETAAHERWDNWSRSRIWTVPTSVESRPSRASTRLLRRELEPLGEPNPSAHGEWFYEEPIRGWLVRTTVAVSSMESQITYWHDVMGVETKRPALRLVSLLSWLGVASITPLSMSERADAAAVGAFVLRMSQHFLASAREFLP